MRRRGFAEPRALACFARAQGPKAEDGRHDRQPEVDDPVSENGGDRSRERRPGPEEGEREERLDRARSRERQRPTG